MVECKKDSPKSSLLIATFFLSLLSDHEFSHTFFLFALLVTLYSHNHKCTCPRSMPQSARGPSSRGRTRRVGVCKSTQAFTRSASTTQSPKTSETSSSPPWHPSGVARWVEPLPSLNVQSRSCTSLARLGDVHQGVLHNLVDTSKPSDNRITLELGMMQCTVSLIFSSVVHVCATILSHASLHMLFSGPTGHCVQCSHLDTWHVGTSRARLQEEFYNLAFHKMVDHVIHGLDVCVFVRGTSHPAPHPVWTYTHTHTHLISLSF